MAFAKAALTDQKTMQTLWMDIKYGFRSLRSRPAITFVALLALALGIGANTALFSILYAVLWKPLPYHQPDRLVMVWEANYVRENGDQNVVNPGNFYDWKAQNRVFENMAAFADGATNLNVDNQPEEVPIQYVTSDFFPVLGAKPLLGRTFVPADDAKDDSIVVLSEGLWQRRFGGDRGIVGKQVMLSGRPATVVGVMRANFQWFVRQGSFTRKQPQLWNLYTIPPEERIRRGRYLAVVARLKPGVTVDEAQANMKVIADQLRQEYRDFNEGWSANAVPLREQLSGEMRRPLWILAGAVGFVLLIACTNVANLMLSRAVSRARELAVRAAIGAGRTRIIRQLLTESVLLSLLGGVCGLFLAVWGTRGLTLLGGRAGIDFGNVSLNWTVLIFTFLLSLLTGVVFGLIPALAISRVDLNEQLKEGSRGTTGEGGKLRSGLVVAQIAFALILLTGAGLLIQSFARLTAVNPGFNPEQVLTFRLLLPSLKYPEEQQRVNWFRNLVDELKQIPGVRSAGMVSFLHFASTASGTSFEIVGRPAPPPGQDFVTKVFVADSGYFEALQIPLKKGRLFSRDETVEMRPVVIINETLARTYFPKQDPIGQELIINMRDENIPTRIIGIVGDVKHESLHLETEPFVYWPHPVLSFPFMNVVLRTEQDPVSLVPTVTSIVQRMDPEQPLADVRTLKEWLGDSTARAEFNMTLLTILASVALILALAGVYGVMSYAVVQRTQEMGIRMALGASSTDIFRIVLRHGAKLIAAGILSGAAVALLLTRLMQSMLYETSTYDPRIFAGGVMFLIAVAILACSIPSLRASRVNPLVALRYE